MNPALIPRAFTCKTENGSVCDMPGVEKISNEDILGTGCGYSDTGCY